MSNQTLESLKKRRTQYVLGKNVATPKTEIEELIKEAIRLAPSSFNSQSSRAVILFGAESDKVWDIAKAELKKIVPADAFAATEAKLNSFAAGIGTVLFYEDQDVVKSLQEQFAAYADNFPIWSEQSGGMAQLAVWNTLSDAGIGASLQHYNPLVDAEIAKAFGVPDSWKLRAQMPFGSNEAPFGDKAFIEDSERFKVFG